MHNSSKFIQILISFCFFQHRDTQETLAVLDRLDLDTEKPSEEEVARKFGFEEDYYNGTVSWWQHLKPQMWSLFDEPYSSNAAKVRFDIFGLCYKVNTTRAKFKEYTLSPSLLTYFIIYNGSKWHRLLVICCDY